MRVSTYRWVVLAVFSLVNLTIQILWIAYAPITGPAAALYGTTDLGIGALAMSFMVMFVPLSIPASWLIDTRGFRFGVGVGAVLMAVCGPLRGLAGTSYPLVLATTLGLAAAQPFFLNAWTKCAALWFPAKERATAVGLVTLANLIGAGLGMGLTPELTKTMSIPTVQLGYGLAAAASSVLFLVFARERPPTPPGPPGEENRALVLDGLKHALTVPSFRRFLVVIFVGMGVFNGVTTWIEGLVRTRGFTPEQAGTLGAIALGGSLLGAVAIAPLSDRQRKRRRYIVLGIGGSIPGVAGLTFAQSFAGLAISCAWMGFFLVSAMPVGIQYASEITRPTPEGTSSGLIQLRGQASVVFVFLMEATKTAEGSFTPSMVGSLVLLGLAAALATRLEEPEVNA